MKETSKPFKNQSVDLFFTFLKQNKAYDAYMRNFSNPDFVQDIHDLNCVSPDIYISDAFRWRLTPEGLKYWDLLNDKWMLILKLFNY